MATVPLFVAKRAVTRMTGLQQSRSMAGMPGYWNRDWMPALTLPKTEEEKRAAAKKYGLIPADYDTYKDDGTGYGDYPKLPMVSADSRDPHALYDMPEFKRNYGEPLHVDADMIGEDRWDINRRFRWSVPNMLLTYIGVMAGFGALFMLGEEIKLIPVRMMPPHKLYEGKKHYSFELEDKK